MKFITQKEIDRAFERGEAASLIQMCHAFNAARQAELDLTINQFREIVGLKPFKDERGSTRIVSQSFVEQPDDLAGS